MKNEQIVSHKPQGGYRNCAIAFVILAAIVSHKPQGGYRNGLLTI